MKLQYQKPTDSKFGAPTGQYTAKFVGMQNRPPKEGQLGYDGKPMGPGLEWQFEILTGEQSGKIVSRTTGQVPTAKNACGEMLRSVSGRAPAEGEEVDLTPFYGRTYMVRIGPNSTGNGTRVETVMLVQGGGNTAPPVTGGPPPRPGKVTPPTSMQKFWIDTGGAEEVQGDGDAVRAFIMEKSLKAADLMLCPVGGKEWKPASQLGFEDARF